MRNIIQVILALFVVGSVMMIAQYWLAPEWFAEENAGTWLGDLLARCDSTGEGLEADFKCLELADCSLSRDELLAHEKRLERFNLMCSQE